MVLYRNFFMELINNNEANRRLIRLLDISAIMLFQVF